MVLNRGGSRYSVQREVIAVGLRKWPRGSPEPLRWSINAIILFAFVAVDASCN